MVIEINDEDLMTHILNNLPLEYENVEERIDRRLDDTVNFLEIV